MLNKFMQIALQEAKKVQKDIPIAALIVKNGEIIASATNKREENNQTIAHAEVLAINEANKKTNSWRLEDCDIYVTLEPCAMCAGAIVNSRIDRVVYGAPDIRFGACGSLFNINSYPLNHAFELTSGVCEDECKALLSDFFSDLRKKK